MINKSTEFIKSERYNFVQTSDGSITVSDKLLGENFHSTYGAIAESNHIFIKNGLNLFIKSEIKILEVGFGTGLNCLLTAINKLQEQKIIYHSIEKYPLNPEIYLKLNYSDCLKITNNLFNNILTAKWDMQIKISDNFELKKINCDLLYFMPVNSYDIIYFDAFSQNVQPELWTKEVFIKLYNCLNKNGILTTYSSKGDVKRAMREANFVVKRISGPIGKRHIIRAIKQSCNN